MNIALIQIAEQECTAQYKCYHKTSFVFYRVENIYYAEHMQITYQYIDRQLTR